MEINLAAGMLSPFDGDHRCDSDEVQGTGAGDGRAHDAGYGPRPRPSQSLGRGGIQAVTEATGIRGKRIRAGARDLKELGQRPPDEAAKDQRIRSARGRS